MPRVRRQRAGQFQFEPVAAVADACRFQVGAEPVGGYPRDQPVAVEDFQHHRCVWMRRTERPTGDGGAIHAVQVALQQPGACVGQTGASIDLAADILQRRAGFDAWKAELPGLRVRVGVKLRIFPRIVEDAAAVAIDERFGRRTLGENDVVVFQFDVEIPDRIDLRAPHDRHPVHQMLGWHQHVVQEHRMQRGDIEIAHRNVTAQRTLLEQDGDHIAVARCEGR